jgi:hypothetical protein
MKLTTCGH